MGALVTSATPSNRSSEDLVAEGTRGLALCGPSSIALQGVTEGLKHLPAPSAISLRCRFRMRGNGAPQLVCEFFGEGV